MCIFIFSHEKCDLKPAWVADEGIKLTFLIQIVSEGWRSAEFHKVLLNNKSPPWLINTTRFFYSPRFSATLCLFCEHKMNSLAWMNVSWRFCGGLILDVKRKLPFFASDFYDALHIQSLSAILFIYLGTVTNAITFGGLLGDATENMQVAPPPHTS